MAWAVGEGGLCFEGCRPVLMQFIFEYDLSQLVEMLFESHFLHFVPVAFWLI